MNHPNRSLGLVAVLLATATACLAQNRTFTNQYTFGDSLSDNGNAFAASAGRAPGPNPPYVGGRWSNGPTWAELLGNSLAVGVAAPTSVKTGMDFAFGGASTLQARNNDSGAGFPALPTQLALFQSHAVSIQRTDLFTVWIGANDILFTAGQANPAVMAPVGISAAQEAAKGIQTLIGLGAKNVLVLNMPDIGLTPAGLSSGGGSSLLTPGSLAYNSEFDSRLAAIAAAAPDVTITRVDAAGLIAQMQRDYKTLGFANANSGLILPASQGGGGDPNGYVFFDGIHPTARTHVLIARVVTEMLNPEPVVGFAATQGTAALALQGLVASSYDARLGQLAAANRATGRADAYASFNYGSGDRVADGWRNKFAYEAQAATVGVDGRISDGFFAGGALDTGRLHAQLSPGAGSYVLEDQSGRLYGAWRGGPVTFAFDGDYGVVDVKGIHRTTAFGGLATNGKTSGTHWGVGAKAFWTLDLGGTQVRPWLGLRTERVKLGAYTERDIASLTMAYGAQEAKSSAGSAGVALGSDTKLGERSVHLDFSAAWHGEFSTDARAVSGQLANNFTRPTTISVTDGNGQGFEFAGAATVSVAKNLSATLAYAGDVRSDDKLAHRVMLSLQTGF